MNNTMKLVERLRRLALTHYAEPNDPSVCTLAADALEASDRRVKCLEEALEPFANEADRRPWVDSHSTGALNVGGCGLTNADLSNARKALRTTLANQGGEK